MRAGLLTEQIEILQPLYITTETGSNDIVYEPSIKCRAYVVFNNGTRENENGEITFTSNVTFKIRRFYQFDENCRIKWNNKEYRILSISPIKIDQSTTIVTEIINE